ncbi:hypothetical protein [Bartonella bovis]|uniref:Uncharacterized protein n=1 Tax=Bartonella bovis m02 TaxID=1094492 RepID=N6VFP8_9HYPH|nr:hypothetical protein [Bartonella bovis]ENN89947.1 hypothetical protein m02_11400 [Bartonella bovis m02]
MTNEQSMSVRRRGRPKGSLNKNTKLLKDALLTAATKAGDHYGHDGLVSYLKYHAVNNPVSFFSLLAKVLPLQVSGEGESNVKTVSRVEIVPVVPKATITDDRKTSVLDV